MRVRCSIRPSIVGCVGVSMFSQIKKYKKAMAEARSYETWQDAALELDYLEGNVEWKEAFASDLYNYELIYDRLTDLRNAHQRRDHWSLIRSLREGLHQNAGGAIGDVEWRWANMWCSCSNVSRPAASAVGSQMRWLRQFKSRIH